MRHRPEERGEAGGEDLAQSRVSGTLGVDQIQVEDDCIEPSEKSPGQVPDRQFVDGRPDQFSKPDCVGRVARRRGGQAEAGTRDSHLQRLVAEAAPEVMDLVNAQETEMASELVHVAVGTFVGGHSHGRHIATPVAMAAGRMGIHGRDLAAPLLEQDARWHQAERREARRGHGAQRDAGLAAASRKHDHSTPAGQFPGTESGSLVVAQLRVGPARRDRRGLQATRGSRPWRTTWTPRAAWWTCRPRRETWPIISGRS
jgi:hypothetical protein